MEGKKIQGEVTEKTWNYQTWGISAPPRPNERESYMEIEATEVK